MAMSLRTDERQFLIYEPNTVEFAYRAVEAAAVAMFGVWLQRQAAVQPSVIRDNMGTIGTAMEKFGEARMQIQAGLAPNDIHDEMAYSQRMWDVVQQWNRNPGSVDRESVEKVLDQFAGALAYMDERTQDTGTNHPSWNSRIISGQPCASCGR